VDQLLGFKCLDTGSGTIDPRWLMSDNLDATSLERSESLSSQPLEEGIPPPGESLESAKATSEQVQSPTTVVSPRKRKYTRQRQDSTFDDILFPQTHPRPLEFEGSQPLPPARQKRKYTKRQPAPLDHDLHVATPNLTSSDHRKDITLKTTALRAKRKYTRRQSIPAPFQQPQTKPSEPPWEDNLFEAPFPVPQKQKSIKPQAIQLTGYVKQTPSEMDCKDLVANTSLLSIERKDVTRYEMHMLTSDIGEGEYMSWESRTKGFMALLNGRISADKN